ncbi:MFS transporter [Bacillus daqingensis]|uniref:MFS transporter n=1 Tax=Bacillus daqingensis TaxID=872396 RepID=A0ABV9P221_9BACI
MLITERSFLIMWIGQLATIFGNRFSEIAIPLIVLQVTGSPLQAALVVICSQAAPLLLSLPAGKWVEHRRKRTVAMSAEAVSFSVMSVFTLAVLFDQLTVWLLGAGLFMIGAAGLFFRVSFGVLVPQVAGRRRLVEAHGWFEGADALSTFAGPVLAGVILSAYGTAAVLAVDAATYAVSFLGIAFLTLKEKPVSKKQLSDESLFAGLRMLISDGRQSFITIQHIVLNSTTTAAVLLVIIYTSESLDFEAWKTGVILSAAGAGNIAAVLMLRIVSRIAWNKLFGTLMLLAAGGMFVISLTDNLALLAAGMFVFDGALSMAFVLNGSARTAVTADHRLARVLAGSAFISGAAAIAGNAFAGSISEWYIPQGGLIGLCLLLTASACCSLLFREGSSPVQELKP